MPDGKSAKLRSVGLATLEHILPLPYALYVNHHYLPERERIDATAAPAGTWVHAEASGLLDRSEQRLQSIETKGTGLATVCGIVAAATAAAISLRWDESTVGAQIVLVLAGFYSFMSLWAPMRLVGPVRRATITADQIRDAADDGAPEAFLAAQKIRCAAENDRATLRWSNQQAASRNDVLNAALLFALWAILTLTGAGNT